MFRGWGGLGSRLFLSTRGSSRQLRTVSICGATVCSLAVASNSASSTSVFRNSQDDHDSGGVVKDLEYGLPSLEEAQRMPVVVLPSVLSESEIKTILEAATRHASHLGSVSRDAQGVQQLNGPWTTHYLHTDGWFKARFPELCVRFARLVREVDTTHWDLMSQASCAERLGDPVPRTIEIHSVEPGGALPDIHHFDSGSMWTFDVMLMEPGADFTAGSFRTLESDGRVISHPFGRGDAVVFPSHKKHHVEAVSWGWRRVLVIEYWHGEERVCAHRCLQRWGDCDYTATMSYLDRLWRAAPTQNDPVLG